MIKLRIAENFAYGTQLYVVQEDENGNVTHIAKPVDLVMEPYTPAYLLPTNPTLRFRSNRETETFLQSVVDQIAQRKTPSPTDHHLKGQLEATQAHLKDLRLLLDLHRKEKL